MRVLVLDHDAEGRELLRTVLQQRGATVQAVASIAEALESLEAWRPDVLVREADSPQGGSYTLFGKIHALDADQRRADSGAGVDDVGPDLMRVWDK